MDLLHGAVEVRFDDVAVKIADDEQRRIQERFTVAEQLLVGFIEIFLFAFVFPGEAALFPHVGKAAFLRLAGVGRFKVEQLRVFDHALLVAEKIGAAGIGFVGRGLLQQPAEIVEVTLIGGGFLARIARPLLFEFGGSHVVVGMGRRLRVEREARKEI